MTVDEGITKPQHQVQRLLGRCLLRLQQYERLLKDVVAGYQHSGTLRTYESNRARRVDKTSIRTLGALAEEMFGSVIFTADTDDPDPTDGTADEIWFSMCARIQLTERDYEVQRAEMKQLVGLRNRLVHHFLDDHDIWTIAGCQVAEQALIDAYDRIDLHVQKLVRWASEIREARQQMADFLQSDSFAEWVVDGILPDGSVSWPNAGIVRAFREAAVELGRDGWTRVVEAGTWIASRYPHQTPSRYGCRSWRHALHESGRFELRRRDVEGQRSIWYRELTEPPVFTLRAVEPTSP